MSSSSSYLQDDNSEELRLKLLKMADKEKFVVERPFGAGECNREAFTILTTEEYRIACAKPKIQMKEPKNCLKCAANMEMIGKITTSDGMCGVYYLDYLCTSDKCRILKEQKIETYVYLQY